jgi:LPS export ABC transporter protein LptC
MKQQTHVSIISHILRFRMLLIVFGAITFLLIGAGCKNDIEVVNALTTELHLPNQSGKNIEFQLTDSGKLKLIFKAPIGERYVKENEEPYREFPKGIEVLFFTDEELLESKITAGYAKQWEEQMLWKANDSVVAQNVLTGERLDTEELFWDEKNKRIYSNVFTKITNEDGIFYGEKGFEADQDLENYKLIGSSGTVKVKDEEIE